MTPAEKDAMALAVLRENADDIGRCAAIFRESHMAAAFALTADQMDKASVEIAEARAHLASSIAEMEETREVLFGGLDRDRDNITTRNLAVVAINALARERERATRAEAELAAVRANAERYVWLRSQDLGHAYIENILFETIIDDYSPPYRSLKHTAGLDAAIDAARGGE